MSDGAILLQIALRIGGLACIAVGGGNALIPALHEQAVVTMHWIDDAQFAQLVGLSQAAPGPNMLLMPLIGWQTAGLAGAVVALVAFLVPSTAIAVLGSRFLARHEDSAAIGAFKWALRPVSGGLMLSSGVVLAVTAARTWPQPAPPASAALTLLGAGVAVLSVRLGWNPLVWLAAAAVMCALAAPAAH